MKYIGELTKGILRENPVLVMLLGMCPTLATSTSLDNAIGMGLAATAVLIGSNAVISMLRSVIPNKIRIASFVVVIAGFVTLVEMLLKAYFPALDKSLGVFIPLIVVNCIILARAEAFASKNKVFPSILDGAGMGLGFTLALAIIAFIREILGAGSLAGIKLFGDGFNGAIVMLLPPGGFLTLGLVLGVLNYIASRRKAGV